jgi:hypothetical protein
VAIQLSEKVRRLNPNIGECPNNIHEWFKVLKSLCDPRAGVQVQNIGSTELSTFNQFDNQRGNVTAAVRTHTHSHPASRVDGFPIGTLKSIVEGSGSDVEDSAEIPPAA